MKTKKWFHWRTDARFSDVRVFSLSSPEGGEGRGEEAEGFSCSNSLTPTLSPLRRGEGARLASRCARLAGAACAAIVLSGTPALADEAAQAATGDAASISRAVGLGAAAAFAIAISVIGAGYAVGRIGSAAMGAAAEKPELLTRSLLFVALAEGLGVLGFAIAMMLVQKI